MCLCELLIMLDRIFSQELSINLLFYLIPVLAIGLLTKKHLAKNLLKLINRLPKKIQENRIIKSIEVIEKYLERFITVTVIYVALIIVPFNYEIKNFIGVVYRITTVVIIIGAILKIIESYSNDILSHKDSVETKNPFFFTVFPLAIKAAKFLIILIGVVIIAVELGFEEMESLLAGVGIGGAAIAFASQDLLKNIFGGFVVLTDSTFNAGDFIKVDTSEGIVEELGLRSTKVRTLDQDLVVVPNSKFSDGSVINYSKRGYRRVLHSLGATYSTPSTKLKTVINDITEMLKQDSEVVTDSISVRFNGFGSSSLDIRVAYLADTPDYEKYLEIKEKINFKIMNIFEKEQVDFAFPSMSVYMEKNE